MIANADTAARTAATTSVGAAGASYTYLGLPMADLVGLGTIIYLLVQITTLLPKAFDNWRQWLSRRKLNREGHDD